MQRFLKQTTKSTRELHGYWVHHCASEIPRAPPLSPEGISLEPGATGKTGATTKDRQMRGERHLGLLTLSRSCRKTAKGGPSAPIMEPAVVLNAPKR